MNSTFRYQGQDVTIQLERLSDGRFRAMLGDRVLTFDAQPTPTGWRLDLNGERLTAHVAAQGSERYVSFGGDSYTLSLPESRASRRRTSASGGDLTAQMPGQVRDVPVHEGDVVERGQTLVLLEAMKMELRVSAPAAGRVKRLRVQSGDVVERGQLLVEIEPLDGA